MANPETQQEPLLAEMACGARFFPQRRNEFKLAQKKICIYFIWREKNYLQMSESLHTHLDIFPAMSCTVLYIRLRAGSHAIPKPNYCKHTRPISTIISEINKHTQAQSEINHAIITTPRPPKNHHHPPTHCKKGSTRTPTSAHTCTNPIHPVTCRVSLGSSTHR